jgi:hypothetical protein
VPVYQLFGLPRSDHKLISSAPINSPLPRHLPCHRGLDEVVQLQWSASRSVRKSILTAAGRQMAQQSLEIEVVAARICRRCPHGLTGTSVISKSALIRKFGIYGEWKRHTSGQSGGRRQLRGLMPPLASCRHGNTNRRILHPEYRFPPLEHLAGNHLKKGHKRRPSLTVVGCGVTKVEYARSGLGLITVDCCW